MLLRRITKHITDQNWFAVFIDFLIVVTGVFIGIQVANWNANMAVQARLDQQLFSFRVELESNQLQFDAYRKQLLEQMDDVDYIREAFNSDLAEIDENKIELKFLNVQRYKVFAPELTTLEELAQTGGLGALSGTSIRKAIEDWEKELAQVKRGYADGQSQRDSVLNPYMMSNIAYGPLLEQSFILGHKIPKSKFRNNMAELAASREFDNHLAYRYGISGSTMFYLDKLIQETSELIDLLKENEAK